MLGIGIISAARWGSRYESEVHPPASPAAKTNGKAALNRLRDGLILRFPDSVARRQLHHLRGLSLLCTPEGQRMAMCGRLVNRKGEKVLCRKAGCPRCAPRAARRHAKRTAIPVARVAREMGGTLWHLTVIADPTADIERVGTTATRRKRAMRNRVVDLRTCHPEFAGIVVVGALEVDLVRDHQFAMLGEAKRRTLASLGFPEGSLGGPVWLPHFHALVCLPPGCDPDLLRAFLGRSFGAPGQVLLQPIKTDKGLEQEVARVARYPHKNRARLAQPDNLPPMLWDAEEIALYRDWAVRFSPRGSRAFRFVIGKSDLIERAMREIGEMKRRHAEDSGDDGVLDDDIRDDDADEVITTDVADVWEPPAGIQASVEDGVEEMSRPMSPSAAVAPAVAERLEAHAQAARGAFAPKTERALRKASAAFTAWAAEAGVPALPCLPAVVAAYVDALAARPMKPASIRQAVWAIGALHRAAGLDDPIRAEEVRLALKRMARALGTRQRQAAPIGEDDVRLLLRVVGPEPAIRLQRDVALLLVMRDLLARRAEAVALDCADIVPAADGSATAMIRRSKTDQEGGGVTLWLSPRTVAHLRRWTSLAGITQGAIFRRLSKAGRPGGRLASSAVPPILKGLAAMAGLDPSAFSGHSARVGMTQDLAASGAELPAIMQAGRWKSPAMPARYAERALAGRGAVARFCARRDI